MPSIEKHVASSKKRTGKEFREVHAWLDSNEFGFGERIKRHDILEIPRNFALIEKQFGKDAAREFLWHMKEDYTHKRNGFMRLAEKIAGLFG